MRQLLFALVTLTVVSLIFPRSADAGFFASSGYPRVGVVVGAPCPTPIFPLYAPPVVYYPYYNAPVVVYSAPDYPRPFYGFRYDDYGRRVVGYTFPGRR